MSRIVLSPPVPSVVAQRLRCLLHAFPAASMGGVEWSALARKYAERHRMPLDLAALGHSSPLGAATALLWDVLRLVDSEDHSNPVVALDDREVMTPRAGSFAAWPSLYQALCSLVAEAEAEQGRCKEKDAIPGVPLSQLRSLLRLNWHRKFGEEALVYLTEQGSAVKLESMEDLVEAVLLWREERSRWRWETGKMSSALDEALLPELDLVPLGPWGELHLCRPCMQNPSTSMSVTPPRQLMRRLSTVKFATSQLESTVQAPSPGAASTAPSSDAGGASEAPASGARTPEEEEEEEEPEEGEATPVAGEADEELSATPFSKCASETVAERRRLVRSQTSPLMLGDRVRIPSGAVQQTRAVFERTNSQVLPSFFARS